ncbi:hypothetical protein MKW94_008683 [Papaver nudicaule]|uniref:WRKY domain-containing protein n=1 Tax=Papaver nudicaule TaxID=74823 RepID=A0AA41SDS5_PAPNU|nr:hypothetical protein [Papaver nudicaule]
MENNTRMSYLDKRALILNELAQAKELLVQLESDLAVATSTNGQLLVPIILSSCEKSLSMLSRMKSEAFTEPQTTGSNESPCLVNDCDSDLSGNSYKKRKTIPTWTEQVSVCEHTGLEGPVDDGYSWRKYGEKEIFGATYPRSYYRCTHKSAQGCLAMKQVQRSDEDSSMFGVTYRGTHTCIQAAHLLPGQSQIKPDQQDEKRQKKTQETIISFATNCHMKTRDSGAAQVVLGAPSFSFPSASTPIPCIAEESDNNNNNFSSMTHDNHFVISPFSSSFISSTTSETNSFSPYRMNNLEGDGQYSTLEYDDLCEFTSAVTSELDSQDLYLDFDFLHGASYDSNFPFHM